MDHRTSKIKYPVAKALFLIVIFIIAAFFYFIADCGGEWHYVLDWANYRGTQMSYSYLFDRIWGNSFEFNPITFILMFILPGLGYWFWWRRSNFWRWILPTLYIVLCCHLCLRAAYWGVAYGNAPWGLAYELRASPEYRDNLPPLVERFVYFMDPEVLEHNALH